MSCDVYKEISMQYDAKREKAESEIKLKKRTLEDKLPKYKELEKKKNEAAISYAREILTKKRYRQRNSRRKYENKCC